MFVVAFTLVGKLKPGRICLFVCSVSQWLVVAGCYYYFCLSDNLQWLYTKVEKAGGLPLGWSTEREGKLFKHNMCM